MLDQAYVQKAKAAGARQRIEVVQFSTDTESVGKVVCTRAEELKADMVVSTETRPCQSLRTCNLSAAGHLPVPFLEIWTAFPDNNVQRCMRAAL